MSAALAALLDNSADLLDPYAPDPVDWSRDVTNGISLAPPIGWEEGDPAFEPGPELQWDGYAVDAIDGQKLADGLKAHREYAAGMSIVPPRRLSLREHIEGVDTIIDTIDQMDEADLTPEAVAELGAMLAGAIDGTKKKVDATSYVFAYLEQQVALNQSEHARIAKRIERFERQIERLTTSVLGAIKENGLDRLEGETSTISRHYKPARLVLTPGATFPEFMFTPEPPPLPQPQLDNGRLKAALKAKRVIPGATLVRGEKLVRS